MHWLFKSGGRVRFMIWLRCFCLAVSETAGLLHWGDWKGVGENTCMHFVILVLLIHVFIYFIWNCIHAVVFPFASIAAMLQSLSCFEFQSNGNAVAIYDSTLISAFACYLLLAGKIAFIQRWLSFIFICCPSLPYGMCGIFVGNAHNALSGEVWRHSALVAVQTNV